MSSDEEDAAGIAAFLNARLDEDEAAIRRNSDGHGLADGFPDYRTYVDGDTKAADAYIEHFGPARMLREVAAKRAVLASLEEDLRLGARTDLTRGGQIALFVTCKRLAAVYSDHPDYRKGW